MSAPLLELEDIHAAYLHKEILHGISLRLERGCILGLLGENGSGKSTTLKVAAGSLHVNRGTIRAFGRDISTLSTVARQRTGFGYLMQGGRVFPNLTVEENHRLASDGARRAGHEPGALGEWFPKLRERESAMAGDLSGGQRQMLAIELVMTQRPVILLLDEPTGALNDQVATMFLNRLVGYVADRGAGVLLVEHAQAAESISNHILRLNNGAIAAPLREASA